MSKRSLVEDSHDRKVYDKGEMGQKIYSEKKSILRWQSGRVGSEQYCCENVEKAGALVRFLVILKWVSMTLANSGDNLRNKSLLGVPGLAQPHLAGLVRVTVEE